MTEIFRHFRPVWYDKTKHELVPLPKGGVSILLRPIEQKTYNFWIYSCPQEIGFSVKQSKASLRTAVNHDIVPWGTIILDDCSVLDKLIKFIIGEEQVLPSRIPEQVLRIYMINKAAEHLMFEESLKMQGKEKIYEER